MAPGAASDQYALGIVVYEWLTGKCPFSGTSVELAMQHVMTPPPPLHEQLPTLPKDVEQVVLRALAKDPKQRFATIEEFAHALEQANQQAETPRRQPPERIPSVVSPLPPHDPASVHYPIDQVSQVSIVAPVVAETRSSTMPAAPLSGVEGRPPSTPPDNSELPRPVADPTAPTRYLPEPLLSPSSYPPSHESSQELRQPRFSWRTMFLLCVLLFLILGSGGGWYATVRLSTTPAQATATARVQAQATATASVLQATAQAQATATAAANAYDRFVAANGMMFGFDAQHTNANPYEQLLNPTTVVHLTKKWAFPTGAGIFSSSAVVNGVVYVGSDDGNLYALDAASGTKKWAFHTGGGIRSSPAVVNGVVYVGSDDDYLYALDAASGTKKWAFHTGNGIDSSPAVVNGVVYVGSNDGNLYAIDAASGSKKWAFQAGTGDSIDSSPAVVNGVVYVGSWDGNLYALDAASGTKKWAFQTGTGSYIKSSPAVVNGVVYVGSDDRYLYALDAASGTKKWAYLTGNSIGYSSPAVVNGVVYAGSDDDSLYAFGLAQT